MAGLAAFLLKMRLLGVSYFIMDVHCPHCGQTTAVDGVRLIGWEEIGLFLGVRPKTAYRLFGMPAFHLPSNKPFTTPGLIIEWLRKYEESKPRRMIVGRPRVGPCENLGITPS